jgi:hypothetical protein
MYYGLDWAKSVNTRLGGGYVPNVLISAAVLWNPRDRRFQKLNVPRYDSLFLDSAGFSLARSTGEYPFSRDAYCDLAAKIGADLVAVRDYPCEPGVDRSVHRTNRDRIRAGIAEARELTASRPGLPWVPVIQGYTREEYAESVALHESEHLVRPLMAVGSLCRRRRADQAWEVLRLVRKLLPDARLHGFGIDLRFLGDRRIKQALWSADTAAWKFNAAKPGGRRFPTNEEKIGNFLLYSGRVDRAMRGNPTTTLEAFG